MALKASRTPVTVWCPCLVLLLAAVGCLIFALARDWSGGGGAEAADGREATAANATATGSPAATSLGGAVAPPAGAAAEAPGAAAAGSGGSAASLAPAPVPTRTGTADAADAAAEGGTGAAAPAPARPAPMARGDGPAADAPAEAEEECGQMFSDVVFNELVQSFPQNPDSKATGYVFCSICTNGIMSCNASVYGGKTRLIASHIHYATDGDNQNGHGPPVVNFCGDNTAGFIANGSPYSMPCSAYVDGVSEMQNMEGIFVEGDQNNGFTAASRARHILEHPENYYFNFHSVASWSHWKGRQVHAGMCRGPMEHSHSRRLLPRRPAPRGGRGGLPVFV